MTESKPTSSTEPPSETVREELDRLKDQLRILSKPYEEALADRVVQKVSQHFLTMGKALGAIVLTVFAYFGFRTFSDLQTYFSNDLKGSIERKVGEKTDRDIKGAKGQLLGETGRIESVVR